MRGIAYLARFRPAPEATNKNIYISLSQLQNSSGAQEFPF